MQISEINQWVYVDLIKDGHHSQKTLKYTTKATDQTVLQIVS